MFEELIASRHDKARALLGWRNNVISVLEDGFRLQNAKATPNWRASRECQVLACTAAHGPPLGHRGGEAVTVALPQVVLSYDEAKHRNQIVVRP